MKAAHGSVFKYGDNVDTDVIIPARYLNSSDPKELATHCMEDIDKDFVKNVKAGDIIVVSLQRHLHVFSIVIPLISAFRLLNARRRQKQFLREMK